MLRALGQLLFRGGVSVGICAVAALCISGVLSLVATSIHPKAVVEATANRSCKPIHCRAKTSRARQVIAAKVQ